MCRMARVYNDLTRRVLWQVFSRYHAGWERNESCWQCRQSVMQLIKKIYWLIFNGVQLLITLLWSAAWIIVALVMRLLTGSTDVPLRMAFRIWAPLLIHGAPARFEVLGQDRIDFSRPHVFVANHQSMIDVCALFMAVPVPLRFMLKSELGQVPFLGWYTHAMGMVFVNRTRPGQARDQLIRAVDLVRDGAQLVAFPEGTRSLDGRVQSFKSGAFRVAIGAGVSVVPVAISGSGQVMPPGGFHIRPGHIRVEFGQPIATANLTLADRRRLAERARREICAMLAAEERAPRNSDQGAVEPRH